MKFKSNGEVRHDNIVGTPLDNAREYDRRVIVRDIEPSNALWVTFARLAKKWKLPVVSVAAVSTTQRMAGLSPSCDS